MVDIQLSYFFKRTKDETIFLWKFMSLGGGGVISIFSYAYTLSLYWWSFNNKSVLWNTKDEFETPLEILLSGSAAKLHGFSLPRNDSRERFSRFFNFFENFQNFSNFFQILRNHKRLFWHFFDNLSMQLLNKNISDKSKMSAEYVEQLIQKLDSLDLETEDKERIYFRKLGNSIIVIGNSAWILLIFHFLNHILSKWRLLKHLHVLMKKKLEHSILMTSGNFWKLLENLCQVNYQ